MVQRFIDAVVLGMSRRAMLVEAMITLVLARLAVRLVPFPRIGKRLGTFVAPDKAESVVAARPHAPGDAQTARLVAWAIRWGVKRLPIECVCLPQAMAAHAMLRRRGISSRVHFGAALNTTKPIDAHAWLDAGGVRVTGYPVRPDIAEIGCFI